ELCGSRTRQLYYCRYCGAIDKECSHDPQMFRKQSIDVKHYYEHALKLSKVPPPSLVKGVRGTSNKTHVPEHLVKGVLRAKNEIAVNKDGTTRYDMTEVPITHFKQSEVETPIKRLVELGYDADINGNPLENEDQILELKPQDLILPSNLGAADESSDAVLFRVACFVDDLLKSLYRLKPYYNLRKKDDLIGHIVIGLAPHISAGIVGRIIGFSKTQGMFAHPLFHAAMRRDADGDEACVMLLMDALLNFSRQFLPDKRGSRTMDSPLVLTSRLIPTEVDDMVHRLDIAWRYPLELYQAAAEYKLPYDVKVDQLGNHLGTPQQYEGIGYTHETGDINNGVLCSAYKLLPSMEDKLKGQMTMAEKLRAVDEGDVARLVIEKHFIKDIKGNLRKFSTQQFRCVKCNRKFRRPTLIGKCDGCGGRVIFTVSDGSVVKYLEPAISLASRYNVPAYLKQSLDLTKQRVEEVFGKEKEKQLGLGAWFAAA
ncbi:DNA polymerase II, partial [Candidatus Woesearchaeota archaeon CG10_big_fil_rev_8_21_14_0_10_47_5]